MSTCARCGLERGGNWLTQCAAEEPEDEALKRQAVIACRDRQIAAQAALLRSVTRELEEAAEYLADGDRETPLSILQQVLEKLA